MQTTLRELLCISVNCQHRHSTMATNSPSSWALCGRCRDLFSTVDGLRALASTSGYPHYSKGDLELHANSGCELCAKLNQQWVPASSLDDNEPVWTFFACREGTSFRSFMSNNDEWKCTGPPESEQHPWRLNKLTDVCAVAKSRQIWLHIVTEEGEWPKQDSSLGFLPVPFRSQHNY